jgi:GTPase SAR1 family protein
VDTTDSFESKCIEEIIEDILVKLNLAYFSVTPYPVGIESRVQEVNELFERDYVCIIGICGTGGIGKTTIAQAIYNLQKGKFEGSCFLENIGARVEQSNGLIDLQEQILSSVQVNASKKVRHVDEGTSTIRDMIWGKRVLLVLDDVDHEDQLEELAIRHDYFQLGSKIIITSRDEQLLMRVEADLIYTLPGLDYDESLQLFSWHAFGKDHPNETYAEFAKKVVYYANGLPLMVKVLGSGLFGKSTYEWNSALEQLKDSRREIFDNLMVCLDLLSDKEKNLFLNIAVFFVGIEKNYTLKTLQDSDLSLESELRVLVRRGLVTIDCLNRLTMHDLIKDMGREIVHRQSLEEPGEYSKLCSHEDVLDVQKYHKVLSLLNIYKTKLLDFVLYSARHTH